MTIGVTTYDLMAKKWLRGAGRWQLRKKIFEDLPPKQHLSSECEGNGRI